MGAMTLWQLSRMGAEAVGFDLHAPGHAFGSAGGDTRMFRSAYHEGATYSALLATAAEQWRELERELDVDLLRMTGGLMIGAEGSAYVESVRATAVAASVPHELLGTADLRARYGVNRVDDGEVAVLDHGSGVLRAEYSVAMAGEAAERRGAVVHRRTAVVDIAGTADGVTVTTADGARHGFDHVVVAAGAWTGRLLRNRVPRLDVQRIAVHWYPVRTPAAFAPEVYPFVCRETDGPIFCVWPTTDGATVKVGLNAGLDHLERAEDLVQEMPAELVPVVDDLVARYLPDAVPTAVRHAVQMDAWTADHDFLVGPAADDDRVTVLAGFSGHGFKMAPAIGLVAARTALGVDPGVPLGAFDPRRFAINPTLR
jgi:sarcosine oxidase